MSSPQDLKLSDLMTSCGSWGITCQEYMKYLGLPLIIREKERGRPKFDDSTGQLRKFYKTTGEMVNSLITTYNTQDELRRAVFPVSEQLLDDITEPSLSTYGPLIWKESGVHLTRITPDYPHYLVYTNIEDFHRIRTCVYYWIVHRAIRGIPSDGSKSKSTSASKPRAQKPTAARRSISRTSRNISSYCEESDEEDNFANIGRQQDDKYNMRFGNSTSPGLVSNTPSRPGNNSQSNVEKALNLSPALQADASAASETTGLDRESIPRCDNPGPASQINDSNNSTNSSDLGLQQRKRKIGPSSPGPHQRMKQQCSIDTHEAHHDAQGRREFSLAELGYRALLASPVHEEAPLNFPVVSEVHAKEAKKRLPGASQQIAQIAEEQSAPDRENDSVLDQNENEEPGQTEVVTARSHSEATDIQERKPSLIVVLKVKFAPTSRDRSEVIHMRSSPTAPTAPTQPLELSSPEACEQLRAKLLDLFDTPEAGLRDLSTLRAAIQYIVRITEDDSEILKQKFGHAFEEYQITLSRWLECAGGYVQFCEVTEFSGDKRDWAAYFKTLLPEKKKPVRKAYFNFDTTMSKWRREPGFTMAKVSDDLAQVLFSITTWKGLLDLDEMRRLCREFNEGLLTWID